MENELYTYDAFKYFVRCNDSQGIIDCINRSENSNSDGEYGAFGSKKTFMELSESKEQSKQKIPIWKRTEDEIVSAIERGTIDSTMKKNLEENKSGKKRKTKKKKKGTFENPILNLNSNEPLVDKNGLNKKRKKPNISKEGIGKIQEYIRATVKRINNTLFI